MIAERPAPAARHDESDAREERWKMYNDSQPKKGSLVEPLTELVASCYSIGSLCTAAERAFIFNMPRQLLLGISGVGPNTSISTFLTDRSAKIIAEGAS
jgi:hypothetical protein